MDISVKRYNQKSKKALLFFLPWTVPIEKFELFCRFVSLFGYQVIAFAYPNDVLNPNLKESLRNIKEVTRRALSEISVLKKEGNSIAGVFGNSLGSVFCFTTAAESNDFKKIIVNTTGATISGTVWSWGHRHNPYFRMYFDKEKISQKDLVHVWELIESINLVPKLKGKEILLYYGKKDEIIPAKQAELLIDVFKENNVEYQIKSNSIFKHIPTLLINLLNFSVWVSFLKQ